MATAGTSLPQRPAAAPAAAAGGYNSDDEAVPDTDPTDTGSLLLERLRAYKHACGYLEDYVTATEKIEKSQAKEYEKVLKTVSDPLREGHHFEQNLGGVAGLFENLRSNTQGIANTHLEVEKQLKGTVLPILARLHSEIKNKDKELKKGAVKGSTEVSKARGTTQKHIELLGQHSAAFSSSGGKIDAANDPYILQRGVKYRLNQQVLAENNNRQDLLAVQDSFQQFEAHVIRSFQQAIEALYHSVGTQNDKQKSMYADILGTSQRIPPDFEFNGFVKRNSGTLIDHSAPPRTVSNISFPNEGHASTVPLISGSLERKSRVALKGYDTGYYVVTASKYLHEFKDDDDFKSDPTPQLSLYLPDCTVGGINGEKFNVKGKDTSKGKVGSVVAMSHELAFKAHTAADAEKWWTVIREAAGEANVSASPVTPVTAGAGAGAGAGLAAAQAPPPQYQQNAPVAATTGQVAHPGTVPATTTAGTGTGTYPPSSHPGAAAGVPASTPANITATGEGMPVTGAGATGYPAAAPGAVPGPAPTGAVGAPNPSVGSTKGPGMF